MKFILLLTAKFIVADLVPIFIGAGIAYVFYKLIDHLQKQTEPSSFSYIYLNATCAGLVSYYLFPSPVFTNPLLQLMCLILIPSSFGFAFYKLKVSPNDYPDRFYVTVPFWVGFIFTLTLIGVRFGLYYDSIPDFL